MVIMSFLTNIIADTLDEDSNEASLNQLFIELFTQTDGLFGFCQSFPAIRVFISPPNVRLKPTWYSRLRPTIIRVFHQFLLTRPNNLQILEDFSGDLEPDGIHYSILHAAYWLFFFFQPIRVSKSISKIYAKKIGPRGKSF